MNQEFIEGQDYYFDENGLFVLTEKFLKKRGFCCHNNCRHCPYQDTGRTSITGKKDEQYHKEDSESSSE